MRMRHENISVESMRKLLYGQHKSVFLQTGRVFFLRRTVDIPFHRMILCIAKNQRRIFRLYRRVVRVILIVGKISKIGSHIF